MRRSSKFARVAISVAVFAMHLRGEANVASGLASDSVTELAEP